MLDNLLVQGDHVVGVGHEPLQGKSLAYFRKAVVVVGLGGRSLQVVRDKEGHTFMPVIAD